MPRGCGRRPSRGSRAVGPAYHWYRSAAPGSPPLCPDETTLLAQVLKRLGAGCAPKRTARPQAGNRSRGRRLNQHGRPRPAPDVARKGRSVGDDGFVGARVDAGTAVGAELGVDDVDVVALRDRTLGAFVYARRASETFLSDPVRHWLVFTSCRATPRPAVTHDGSSVPRIPAARVQGNERRGVAGGGPARGRRRPAVAAGGASTVSDRGTAPRRGTAR